MPTKKMFLRHEEVVVCHYIFTDHIGDKEEMLLFNL
jgi:hypothetical protein